MWLREALSSGFSTGHAFAYSPRWRTAAANLAQGHPAGQTLRLHGLAASATETRPALSVQSRCTAFVSQQLRLTAANSRPSPVASTPALCHCAARRTTLGRQIRRGLLRRSAVPQSTLNGTGLATACRRSSERGGRPGAPVRAVLPIGGGQVVRRHRARAVSAPPGRRRTTPAWSSARLMAVLPMPSSRATRSTGQPCSR
jgi:hypothetical protein